jgi:nitrogen fixation-related uncharacterized protein
MADFFVCVVIGVAVVLVLNRLQQIEWGVKSLGILLEDLRRILDQILKDSKNLKG